MKWIVIGFVVLALVFIGFMLSGSSERKGEPYNPPSSFSWLKSDRAGPRLVEVPKELTTEDNEYTFGWDCERPLRLADLTLVSNHPVRIEYSVTNNPTPKKDCSPTADLEVPQVLCLYPNNVGGLCRNNEVEEGSIAVGPYPGKIRVTALTPGQAPPFKVVLD